jgi:hypothetical protein
VLGGSAEVDVVAGGSDDSVVGGSGEAVVGRGGADDVAGGVECDFLAVPGFLPMSDVMRPLFERDGYFAAMDTPVVETIPGSCFSARGPTQMV